MKRFEAVIQSETAPSTSSLWLNNKKIWYFDGGWKAVEGSYDAAENSNLNKLRSILVDNKSFDNIKLSDISYTHSIIRSILNARPFSTGMPISGLDKNSGILEYIESIVGDRNVSQLMDRVLFEDYTDTNISSLNHILDNNNDPLNTYIPVNIEGDFGVGGWAAFCPAVYYNAHIYALLGGNLVVYNIDTNEGPDKGMITKLKTIDLTLLPAYIDLELGNSATVKAYNLEQLQKVTGTQFFVHADYGIGVGSFNSGSGGETTIQTAGGERVHYLITAEGECVKQADRFEHSDLFYNLGKIDVTTLPKTISITDGIKIGKFRKATSLAFEASSNNTFIDDVSMNQVSVNTVTNQRIYTSPDLICVQDQDWNYIKATATSSNNKIDIYLEKV